MDGPNAAARYAALETQDPEAAQKELQERIPGAQIWYVQQHDGHTEWILRLHGDSPGHLMEALREAAKDTEVAQ
jgi:hypothetical protein